MGSQSREVSKASNKISIEAEGNLHKLVVE